MDHEYQNDQHAQTVPAQTALLSTGSPEMDAMLAVNDLVFGRLDPDQQDRVIEYAVSRRKADKTRDALAAPTAGKGK